MLSARNSAGWIDYRRLLIKMLHTSLLKNTKRRTPTERKKDHILYDESGLLLFIKLLQRVPVKNAGFCNVTLYVKITMTRFSAPANIIESQEFGEKNQQFYLLMPFEITHKLESDPLTSELATKSQKFGKKVRSIGGPKKVTGMLCAAAESTNISASRNSLSGKSLLEWNNKFLIRRERLKGAGNENSAITLSYIRNINVSPRLMMVQKI